jgi:pantoate--beta-alanine ligase
MEILQTVQDAREARKRWFGETVALVPTMGALHIGHQALIKQAKAMADRTVVSIFVNPLQFGPHEDFNRYPRPEAQDLAICRELGVDAVFSPTVETMYPDGKEDQTVVLPPEALTEQLCGMNRPGHFTGVATVVLKLFNMIQPDYAVFGEKDAQQLAVLQKMVRDLNIPVTLIPHPTVRDESGLALSSRNAYLNNPAEKEASLLLSAVLKQIQAKAQSMQDLPAQPVLSETLTEVLAHHQELKNNFKLEYLNAVDLHTFKPVERLSPNTKVLIAARVGDVRLIDNIDLVAK